MNKRVLSIILAVTMIYSLMNFTAYARNSYNICEAEEAFESKVKNSKKKSSFTDAYMVDIFNNGCPVLVEIEYYARSGCNIFSFQDNSIVDIDEQLMASTNDFFGNAFSSFGLFAYEPLASAGSWDSFFAIDDNNKIYIVKYTSSRNGRHNNYRDAEVMVESDIVTNLKIGYFEDEIFHKLYSNEIYRCNNGTEFTVDARGFDENGNEFFLDLGVKYDKVFEHFSLKRLIYDESSNYYKVPNKKGDCFDKYTCTPSAWAKPLIEEAITYGIVPENLQHLYKSKISRGEFCQLICSLIERTQGKSLFDIINERGGYNFRDKSPASFDMLSENYISMTDYLKSNSPIGLCEKAGIINGYSEGNLAPNDFLTRQQAAVIIERTLQYLGFDKSNTSAIQFNDASSFANWATNSIDLISACAVPDSDIRIMSGDENGNFMPEDNFTIEQAIITVKRTIDYIRVPIVRWIQDDETQNELMSTLVFEDKYLKCKVFDRLIAANDFEYDALTMNAVRYLNSPATAFKDMFYYACFGENEYAVVEQPKELKLQLARIISNITDEDDAQIAAESKIYNEIVAKMLKYGVVSSEHKADKMQKYIDAALETTTVLKYVIDWSKFSQEQIEYITHDYVESMLYLDTLKEAMEVTECDSELLDNAIYQLREDYHGWWVNNVCEKVAKDTSDELMSNSVETYLKNLLDKDYSILRVIPFAVEASGLNEIYDGSTNVLLSLPYSNMLIDAYKEFAHKIADDNYTAEDVAHCERLFELCKAAKINEYKNLLSATDGNSLFDDPFSNRGLQTVQLIKILDKPIISLSGTPTSNPVNFLKKEIEALKKLSYN